MIRILLIVIGVMALFIAGLIIYMLHVKHSNKKLKETKQATETLLKKEKIINNEERENEKNKKIVTHTVGVDSFNNSIHMLQEYATVRNAEQSELVNVPESDKK